MRRGEDGWVVPLYRKVKRGTLGGILRQAAIAPAEFVSALSKLRLDRLPQGARRQPALFSRGSRFSTMRADLPERPRR